MSNEEFNSFISKVSIHCIEDNLSAINLVDTTVSKLKDDSKLVSKVEAEDDNGQRKSIIVTISSYKFTVLTVLHFELDNKVLKQRFFNKESDDQKALIDGLSEFMNQVVGHLKRELQNSSISLGMSTPSMISQKAIWCIPERQIDQSIHYQLLDEKQNSLLGVSFFTSTYGEFEFVVNEPESSTDVGEIEFF